MKIIRRFCSSLLLVGALSASVSALPEGANVSAGAATISTNGNRQTIRQMTDRAIINWNGFNIDVGELVQFIQPSSLSAILNRVVGQDPSMILGSMQANGQVFLVNPNGVIFGHSANIDVGSLVVSTLNITDDDFMSGTLRFEQDPSKELSAVINHGTIKIDRNGFLVLTGPMVANDGIILAQVGQVAMAAGTKSTISFDPTGMIQLELPADTVSESGLVSLSQSDAGEVLSSLVQSSSSQVGEIVYRDGKTFLEVASGTLVNAGEIRADGASGFDAGRILLDSTANTILGADSLVSAAGQGINSSGGEVYVLSEQTAISEVGSVVDVSGGLRGDGGFAEQSSRGGYVGATVRAGATDGQRGTFLIDPERIEVVATGNVPGTDPNRVYILENSLETATGDVVLETEDGIDFQALADGSLLLPTDISLTFNLTNPGGDGTPALTFANPNDEIILSGLGNFHFSSVTGTEVQDLKVTTTGSGSITLDLAGAELTGNSRFTLENGSFNGDVSGVLNIVSTGETLLEEVAATTISATGQDFVINGTVAALDEISFNANSIEGFGELSSSNISLTAQAIGTEGPLSVRALSEDPLETLTLQTAQASLNVFSTQLDNLIYTNTEATADVDVRSFGEGTILRDSDGEISTNDTVFFTPEGVSLDLTISGDRTVFAGNSGDLKITTSGQATNGLAVNVESSMGALDLTADDISLAIGGQESSAESVTATATSGNITIDSNSFSELVVDLTAANQVQISSGYFSPLTAVRGTIDALNVDVTATQIDLDLGTRVEEFRGFSDGGESGATNLVVRANSETLDAYLVSFGDVSLENLGGDVTLFEVFANDADIRATGDITTGPPIEGAPLNANNVVLNAGGQIDVSLWADSLQATAGGDIVAETESPGEFFLQAESLSGDVTFLHTGINYGEGAAPLLGLGQITANNVNLTVDNGRIFRLEGSIDADNIVLSALTEDSYDGSVINVHVGESTVQADALGDIQVLGTGAAISVSGSSNGNFQVANFGDIQLGPISGASIQVSATEEGSDITSNGTLDSADVSLLGDNITASLNTSVLEVIALGDVLITNGPTDLQTTTLVAGGTVDFTTVGSANLTSFEGADITLDIGQSVTGSLVGQAVDVTANSIDLNVTADTSVVALSRTGDLRLTGNNPGIELTATAVEGNVDVSMQGDLTVNSASGNAVSLNITDGDLSSGPGRISGQSVNLSADNMNVLTATEDLTASALTGSVTIDNLADAVVVSISAPETVSVVTTGDISGLALSGTSTQIEAAGLLNGFYSGSSVSLTGASIDAAVGTSTLTATATAGDALIVSAPQARGFIPLTLLDSSAVNGDFTLSHVGDLTVNAVEANNINLSAGGEIVSESGRLSGQTVSLTAGNVDVQTATASLSVNSPDGDITVDNLSPSLEADINTIGSVSLTTSGDLTGSVLGGPSTELVAQGSLIGTYRGNTLLLNAASIDAGIDADTLTAVATNGNVVLSSISEPAPLLVTGSSALKGDFTLTYFGDLTVDELVANNVILTATGQSAITSGEGRITGQTVSLNADSIDVETATADLTAEATDGDLTVDNQSADLTADLTATGNVTLTSDGNIAVEQVQATDVSLTSTSGDLTSGSGRIAGQSVTLSANNVEARTQTSNLTVSAPAGDIELDNLSDSLNVSLETSGNIELTNSGGVNGNVTGDATTQVTAGGQLTGSYRGETLNLNGTSIEASVEADTLTAVATDGDALLTSGTGEPAPLTLTGSSALNGDFTLTHFGDLTVDELVANNVTLTATGQGALTSGEGRITGQTVSLNADSIEVQTATADLTANADGNVIVDNLATDLNATVTTPGIVELTTSGNLTGNLSGGTRTQATANGQLSGDYSGDSVVLTGADINAGVDADTLTAVATNGSAVLTSGTGEPAPLTLTGSSALNGDFTLTHFGDLTVDELVANNVTLTATGQGALTSGEGRITGQTVSLNADSIEVQTVTADLTANADGNVIVDNLATDLNATVTTPGTIELTTSGNLTGNLSGGTRTQATANGQLSGDYSGDSVLLTGASINVGVDADTLTAVATNGSAVLTSSSGEPTPLTLTGSSALNGDFTLTHFGDLTVDELVANNVTLTATGQGALTSGEGRISGQTVNLNADSIEVETATADLTAEATDGDLTVDNQSADLTADLTATGNVTLTSDGNIAVEQVQATDVSLTSTSGDLTSGSGRIAGQSVTLSANNVEARTQTSNLTVSAPAGDIELDNLSDDVNIALNTAGDINFSGSGNVSGSFVGGDSTRVSAGGALSGFFSSESLTLTGQTIEADILTDLLTAVGTGGNVTITSNAESEGSRALTLSNSLATGGDFSLVHGGDLTVNSLQADNVDLTALNGGDLRTGIGRITAQTSTLNASDVDVRTATANLIVNSPTGNVAVDNLSSTLTSSIGTTGTVLLSSSGDVTGSTVGGLSTIVNAGGSIEGFYQGNSLTLNGSSIEADFRADSLRAVATGGDATLTSSPGSPQPLSLVESSAINGDFSLTHDGDISFDTIRANNVNIQTTGDITDTANTIIASGISLSGNNILVNTQGQVIVINALGQVVVTNTLVDVGSLTISANGTVSFGTSGDLVINQVAGGSAVTLSAGGNVGAIPGAVVKGGALTLQAGGTITPNLTAPLQLDAANSIFIQAQGGSIAAALQGSFPASSIVIGTPSGPIFYNGQQLNGAPVPPVPPDPVIPDAPVQPETPVLPPIGEVIDQIGQQNGQVVDDGSVGSAANDGLVEPSATQKLVAKLTEAAGGGPGGGTGVTTEVLITLEVDELGEVTVQLSEPSPFDAAIENKEDLSADDILDLDTEELGEVKLALFYDPVSDQLILSVNLSADDVLDLDVSEFQEIPIKLDYRFNGDPAYLLEYLRAADIIDLEVEDLGDIPIKIEVTGGEDAADNTQLNNQNQGESK